MDQTQVIQPVKASKMHPRDIMTEVNKSLNEKGYNTVNQVVGYIISGDPTYITSHNNARGLINQVDRDELLEEIVSYYLNNL